MSDNTQAFHDAQAFYEVATRAVRGAATAIGHGDSSEALRRLLQATANHAAGRARQVLGGQSAALQRLEGQFLKIGREIEKTTRAFERKFLREGR